MAAARPKRVQSMRATGIGAAALFVMPWILCLHGPLGFRRLQTFPGCGDQGRSSATNASMISSKVTGSAANGACRNAGAESTAQASDAQADRMARRSECVSAGSMSTSAGRSYKRPGCSNRSISGSQERAGAGALVVSVFVIIDDFRCGVSGSRALRRGSIEPRRHS
jgi:hypothetical protein